MERGMIIRMGIGTAVMAAMMSASIVAFSKDLDAGSTQRFRGTATSGHEKARAAARTTVTLEQAIQAAKQKVPGKVIGAELTEKDMAVWDVQILSLDGKEIHMSVDATSGTVYKDER